MKILNLIACLIFFTAINSFGQEQFKVLVFSKTAGWHHQSIKEGVTALREMGKEHNFYVEWHEDASRINKEFLENFDVVVFLNTTEDIFNEEQQQAFEAWYRQGKGFVGIHSASDTEYDWEWYTKMVGRLFHVHPPVVTAKIDIINHDFPGLGNAFDSYLITDEFYQFSDEKIEGLNYLITIDESTYDPKVRWDNKSGDGMGDFHPMAWYHNYDGGRAFYTAFGHNPKIFENSFFLQHLFGGIYWAATGKGIKE